MAWKIIPEVSPRNGSCAVAISYSAAPKENKSVQASRSFPLTCSGDRAERTRGTGQMRLGLGGRTAQGNAVLLEQHLC